MVNVRAVRKALGLSLREVARRMDVSHPLLSRAERNPSLFYPRLRQRYSRVLGVREDMLFPPDKPGQRRRLDQANGGRR
jgi:transcriptional regulator with XRE-family HTH domain